MPPKPPGFVPVVEIPRKSNDLLPAQASIDWPVSQLPSLQRRLDAWLNLNVHIGIEETPLPATHNRVVATEKSQFPLAFSAEIGAYINSIRSSLDMLATALARRHNILNPREVYFPVATSEAKFLAGDYPGSKFVKGLPRAERDAIESLKPYRGGNEPLWTLHQLDIKRKHRHLVGVAGRIIAVTALGPRSRDDFINTGSWMRPNEKTEVGLIRKGSPNGEVKFAAHVAFDEAALVERKPVIAALAYFASLANNIIGLFD